MTEYPAVTAHLKGCRVIYESFWNNTVSLGRGEAHGELGKLFTLSGEAGMND